MQQGPTPCLTKEKREKRAESEESAITAESEGRRSRGNLELRLSIWPEMGARAFPIYFGSSPSFLLFCRSVFFFFLKLHFLAEGPASVILICSVSTPTRVQLKGRRKWWFPRIANGREPYVSGNDKTPQRAISSLWEDAAAFETLCLASGETFNVKCATFKIFFLYVTLSSFQYRPSPRAFESRNFCG